MCINQKELKQNKISEMDGVYHHSKTIQRESSQLVPEYLNISNPLRRWQTTLTKRKPQIHENP